ncbi:MAG: glycosyltransferase family 39 protein [Planctomycetota bacterium]
MMSPSEALDESSDSSAKRTFLSACLLLMVAAWMLWGIGKYGLYEPHEAQYAGAASEMLARGDWVTPYLNGAPELNKPPLFYWLIALSLKSLYHSERAPVSIEFVARLPLALIGLCGLLLAWQWARELWGRRAGRCAALMLAVAPGWYVFAHQLLTDELLSVLIFASLYLLWKALGARHSRWRWGWFYGVIGLAVLTKGLPGAFFPLLTLALFVLVRRDWTLLGHCRPLLGILVICCIVAPWAALFELHNPGALKYMLVNEHLQRLRDQRIPHDYGCVQVGATVFLLFSLLWCAPWSLLLPQTGWFAYRSIKEETQSKQHRAVKDAVLLLGFGAGLPLVFFTFVPARLVYYGLPAAPPLVVLCAGFLSAPERWSGRSRLFAVGLAIALGLAIASLTPYLPTWLAKVPDLKAMTMLLKDVPVEALLLAAGLVLCGLLLYLRQAGFAFAVLIVVLGTVEAFSIGQFHALDSIFSSKSLVAKLAPALGGDCVWISEGSQEVGASAGLGFYLRLQAAGTDGRENSPVFAGQGYVLIMNDDPRRPPPAYPGPAPEFLIDHKRLEELWARGVPSVFVTDFQRIDWKSDKPLLPVRDCRYVPLAVGGHRKVYANPSAWQRLAAAGLVPADGQQAGRTPGQQAIR